MFQTRGFLIFTGGTERGQWHDMAEDAERVNTQQ